MMQENHVKLFDEVLERYVKSLEISDSQFKEAKDRYKSVGNWLLREDSTLKDRKPNVYTQGSFLLGTVVKPLSEDAKYDIDSVCQLNYIKSEITQQDLKEKVGKELKEYASARSMKKDPKPGKRCWALEYDDVRFHMDVLPAIPDQDLVYRKYLLESGINELIINKSICITDNILPNYSRIAGDWLKSNPEGYAQWFKSKMKTIFEKGAAPLLEKRIYTTVEEVPLFEVKTPLQKAIQLLKRHRDIMFENDSKKKPISIIITTLTAHAYQNESSLSDALRRIVDDMDKYIEKDKNDRVVIRNPVRPDENFADKWEKDPALGKNFFTWLEKVRFDLSEASAKTSLKEMVERLGVTLGKKAESEILKEYGYNDSSRVSPSVIAYPEVKISSTKPWKNGNRFEI